MPAFSLRTQGWKILRVFRMKREREKERGLQDEERERKREGFRMKAGVVNMLPGLRGEKRF